MPDFHPTFLPRKLSVTKLGWIFILLTLAVGVAALNSGNNLLFLLLGAMLTAIVVNGILSEAILRDVEITRRLGGPYQATRSEMAQVAVANADWWPAVSLEVTDLGTRIRPGSGESELSELGRAYVGLLAGGATENRVVRYRFPRRGAYRLNRFVLTTRFPFQLFEKSRAIAEYDECLVLPERREMSAAIAGLDRAGHRHSGQQGGRTGTFHSLREYRPGDQIRRVHWKSSARLQKLVVEQKNPERARCVRVALWNILAAGRADIQDKRRAFEVAVQSVRGLLEGMVERGYRFELWVFAEGKPDRPQVFETLERALRTLAVVQLRVCDNRDVLTGLIPAPDIGIGFRGEIDEGQAESVVFIESLRQNKKGEPLYDSSA